MFTLRLWFTPCVSLFQRDHRISTLSYKTIKCKDDISDDNI